MNRPDAIAAALRHLAPKVPRFEAGAILDHALASPGLRKASPEEAAWLSLTAYIRHAMTEYDALLGSGYDVESARHFVRGDMDDVLAEWGARRPLSDDDG